MRTGRSVWFQVFFCLSYIKSVLLEQPLYCLPKHRFSTIEKFPHITKSLSGAKCIDLCKWKIGRPPSPSQMLVIIWTFEYHNFQRTRLNELNRVRKTSFNEVIKPVNKVMLINHASRDVLPWCITNRPNKEREYCVGVCKDQLSDYCWRVLDANTKPPPITRYQTKDGEYCDQWKDSTLKGPSRSACQLRKGSLVPQCSVKGALKDCYEPCNKEDYHCLWPDFLKAIAKIKGITLPPCTYTEQKLVPNSHPNPPHIQVTAENIQKYIFVRERTNEHNETGFESILSDTLWLKKDNYATKFKAKFWTGQPQMRLAAREKFGWAEKGTAKVTQQEGVFFEPIHETGRYEQAIGCRRTFNRMKNYQGTRSITANGKRCDYWSSLTLPQLDALRKGLSESLFAKSRFYAFNYCRNPDNSICGPWCPVAGRVEPCFNLCLQQNVTNVTCAPRAFLARSPNPTNIFQASKTRYNPPFFANYPNDVAGDICQHNDYNTSSFTKRACIKTSTSNVPICKNTLKPCMMACEDIGVTTCYPRKDLPHWFYTGTRAKTKSDKECAFWWELSPSMIKKWRSMTHDGRNDEDFMYLKLPHNYCRNLPLEKYERDHLMRVQQGAGGKYFQYPEAAYHGPACFRKKDHKLEPCFLACEDEYVDFQKSYPKTMVESMKFYAGLTNTPQESGTECGSWSDMYRHDGTGGGSFLFEGNFCRNPDADPLGPWCFDGGTGKKTYCFKIKGNSKKVFEKLQRPTYIQKPDKGNRCYAEPPPFTRGPKERPYGDPDADFESSEGGLDSGAIAGIVAAAIILSIAIAIGGVFVWQIRKKKKEEEAEEGGNVTVIDALKSMMPRKLGKRKTSDADVTVIDAFKSLFTKKSPDNVDATEDEQDNDDDDDDDEGGGKLPNKIKDGFNKLKSIMTRRPMPDDDEIEATTKDSKTSRKSSTTRRGSKSSRKSRSRKTACKAKRRASVAVTACKRRGSKAPGKTAKTSSRRHTLVDTTNVNQRRLSNIPDGDSRSPTPKRARTEPPKGCKRRPSKSPAPDRRPSRTPSTDVTETSGTPDRRNSKSPMPGEKGPKGCKRRPSKLPTPDRRGSHLPAPDQGETGPKGCKRRPSKSPSVERRDSRSPASNRADKTPKGCKRRPSQSPTLDRRGSRSPGPEQDEKGPKGCKRRPSKSPSQDRRGSRSPAPNREETGPKGCKRRPSQSPSRDRR